MTIILNGTADHAPAYFSNATGYASWSGKHVDELSAKQAIEIFVFCQNEARRQGWNAEHRGDQTDRNEFLFHPEFLDGHPHLWWNLYQQMGREEYRATPHGENKGENYN